MGRRVDLKEAAELLGSTSEAIRKRAKRGTLASETGEDGKMYVWVPDEVDGRVPNGGPRVDEQVDERVDAYPDVLTERMVSEIDHLREQLREEREANRENRRIIAGLVQRVPELEPVPEPREAPKTPTNLHPTVVPQGDDAGQETAKSPSWWRRVFGA